MSASPSHTPKLKSPAWLLRGISSVPGQLTLRHGRVAFTGHDGGSAWPFQLRKLEAQTGRDGLAEALLQGQRAVVFEAPLEDVDRVWVPWFYFGGGLKLRLGGRTFRFSFHKPGNEQVYQVEGLGGLAAARREGARWMRTLEETGFLGARA